MTATADPGQPHASIAHHAVTITGRLGHYRVELDGVDIAHHLAAVAFEIAPDERGRYDDWPRVTLTLGAGRLVAATGAEVTIDDDTAALLGRLGWAAPTEAARLRGMFRDIAADPRRAGQITAAELARQIDAGEVPPMTTAAGDADRDDVGTGETD